MTEPIKRIPDLQEKVQLFSHSEIDRGAVPMSGELLDEDRTPLIGVALDVLRSKGTIAMLDAGCGTGHGLWDVKDQLLFRTSNRSHPDVVHAIGINDQDFSQKSEQYRVAKAIREGELDYIVGDIETVSIPSRSQDIIWSYEVLPNNPTTQVVKIIPHLIQMLNSQGRLYFNLNPEQMDDPEISTIIIQARENGMTVFTYRKEKFGEKRVFVMLKNNPTSLML